jgi:hypothetical protein
MDIFLLKELGQAKVGSREAGEGQQDGSNSRGNSSLPVDGVE